MEWVTYSQPAAYSYKCYVKNLPFMAKVKLKEWCRSNDSQNVNSDYSPNITPAINSIQELPMGCLC